MSIATVTTKGQVTIPQDVRIALGIEPGARVEFFDTGRGSWEFIAHTGSINDLRGMFAHDGPPITLEEMDDAIAEGAAEGNM
ncbi:MAG: AbrB/MazE/SpoVT family DNA-binding domain-containing protein [Pseudolysinimonas sp.]